MHILSIPERLDLGRENVVEGGEYVIDDQVGAQLMALCGSGTMDRLHEARTFPAAHEDWNGKSLVITRTGGFGDIVLLTPVLREIKRRWPRIHIAVSTMRHYAAVLENLPYVDAVAPWPLPLTTARGFDGWVFLENAVERNPRAREVHMTSLFGELCGLDTIEDMLPDYRVTFSEAKWAAQTFPRINGTRRVCVQPKTSARARNYPFEMCGAFTGELLKRGWEVFLMGERGDVKLDGKVAMNLRNVSEMGLTFRQSCAILAGSDCFVGSDSALVHVAGALGIPGVGLYGPFPWKLRTAYSPSIRGIQGVGDCSPCFHHTNPSRGNHFPDHCPSRSKGICGVLATIEPKRIVAMVEKIALNPGESGAVVPFEPQRN